MMQGRVTTAPKHTRDVAVTQAGEVLTALQAIQNGGSTTVGLRATAEGELLITSISGVPDTPVHTELPRNTMRQIW